METLVDDLRGLSAESLAQFLNQTDREVEDVYRRQDHSWTRLRREAGAKVPRSASESDERDLLRALRRMLNIDDPERVQFYREILARARAPKVHTLDRRQRRLLLMLHYDLWGSRRRFSDLDASLQTLWAHKAVCAELSELLAVLDARSKTLSRPSGMRPEIPLHVHAQYTRDEILGAYGEGTPSRPPVFREGVRHIESAATDVLLVTLKKAERDYSPTTMYRDYAISPTLFHWESQSTQRAGSPTIRRYEDHVKRNHTIALFVRDRKILDNGVGSPYVFLGPVEFVNSSGDRPVSFTWRLTTPMPEELFEVARTVGAA